MGRKYGRGLYGRGTYDLYHGIPWEPIPGLPEGAPPEFWIPDSAPSPVEIWGSALTKPVEKWIPVAPKTLQELPYG